MSFAENLLAVRKRMNLSQEDLSRISGISQSAISAIEAGQRSPSESTMIMLAKALNCPLSSMLEDQEIKKSPPSEDDEDMVAAQELLRSLRGEKLKEAISHLRWIQSNQ